MDLFKYNQLKFIGIGGLKCQCCNDFRNNKGVNKKLNRMARRCLKMYTNREIFKNLEQ